MLAKEHRLCKDSEFNQAFRRGLLFEVRFLAIRIVKNSLGVARFGFVVSKKISNQATVRNLIKRRISEAVRAYLPRVKPEYDLVIIARAGIKEKNFEEIKAAVGRLLNQAGMLG